MTQRRGTRVVLAASMVAASLLTWNGTASPTRALAETTTTITFDDLAAGTAISNQYDAQGVDFEKGIIGDGVFCYPVVTQVSSQDAQSGDQVADISCANGEFPNSSVWGVLKNSAEHVSLYAGFFPNWANPPAGTGLTLTAYDADGNVITSDTETGPTGGTHTLLQVASNSPNIVQFSVRNDINNDGSYPNVAIDNLTFDNPAGVPPDFRIHPQIAEVGVAQGFSSNLVLDVNRENGSAGAITFSASGLPSGVHATFSPNPVVGASTTVTISADANAPLTTDYPYPNITLRGTPASAAVAPGSRSVHVGLDVFAPFTITLQPSLSVPPCSQVQVPVRVTWSLDPITLKQPFSGPIALSASGVPSDDQASFNPATVSPENGTNSATSTLTLTSQSDVTGPNTTMTVTGKSGQLNDSAHSVSVSRAAPSIDSVSPIGGQSFTNSPTNVTIDGHGFCAGTTVAFGNALARDFPQYLAPDGTQMRVALPWRSTTGSVYAVPPGHVGNIDAPGTAVSPQTFTVDSYRNTSGFSFDNSSTFQSNVGGYSFSDVSDVFGYAQTHVSVNPCWPFGNCPLALPIPDPLALIFWGIVNAALQDGQCFGFALGSQRLLHGDQAYSAFQLQPGAIYKTVWNLQGPDSAGGPTGDLAHFIHLTHMEQFSAEGLNYWLSQATYNAVFGDGRTILGDVESALANGDHPLIELRNGGEGHVVVAYAASGTSAGTIDVYDPNQEFTTAEDQDVTGATHDQILSNSQINVASNGHWTFQGNLSDSPWQAGPGSIVVVPYGTVPVQPTLPVTLTGFLDFLFGSAHVSQVKDPAGHTLLNPDGSINTNSKTRIPDATRFAALSGSSKPGPDVFLLGKAAAYTQTINMSGPGGYHDSLLGRGITGTVTADSAAGLTDRASILPTGSGLQLGQVGGPISKNPRNVTTQMVSHAPDGSQRTATLGTAVSTKGLDTISFDSTRNAVTVKAGGQTTGYSLVLSWDGPHGYPQTFVAPKQTIGAGESATLTPANWSTLDASTAKLRIVHTNGSTTTKTVTNTVLPTARYSMATEVTNQKSGHRRLEIDATVSHIVKGSSAVFTWEVLKGTSVVSSHGVTITSAKLRKGLLKRTFDVKTHRGAQYTFKGSVAIFTPTTTGSFSSQILQKQKGFRG